MGAPMTLADYPEWCAAHDRLYELRARLTEIDLLIAGGGRALATEDNAADERAAVLLARGELVPRRDTDAARREISRLFDERSVTHRAEELQQRVISTLRSRLSAEICERLNGPHRALVRRLGLSLVALAKVGIEELDFRDRLRAGDVAFSSYLRAMPVTAIGDPRDRTSRVAMWLAEAIENGLVERGDVPREWLAAWER